LNWNRRAKVPLH